MTVIYALVLVVLAIVGLIGCFRGYQYLPIFMMLYGLYLGYTAASRIVANVPELQQWGWALSLAIGLVIGLLARFFISFAIFLAGGLLGIAIYSAVRSANPIYFSTLEGVSIFLIGLVLFVLFGILMVVFKKYFIVIGTAFYGAYSFMDALGLLFGMMAGLPQVGRFAYSSLLTGPGSAFQTVSPALIWTIVVVLAILGIIAQLRHAHRKGAR